MPTAAHIVGQRFSPSSRSGEAMRAADLIVAAQTVTPSTRRIYAAPVRTTWGFECLCPLAHQRCASSAVCLHGAGGSPAASFRRRVAAVCRSARGSCHQGPQRPCTSTSLPDSLSLSVDSASRGATRHGWRTHGKGHPVGGPWRFTSNDSRPADGRPLRQRRSHITCQLGSATLGRMAWATKVAPFKYQTTFWPVT